MCGVLGIKKKCIMVFADLGIAWLGKGEKGRERERERNSTRFEQAQMDKNVFIFIFLYHHLLSKSFKQSYLEEFYKKKRKEKKLLTI